MTHPTPGPWIVEGPYGPIQETGDYGITNRRGDSIATVPRGYPETYEERTANARLIAKAPEMRALLEEIADRAHSYWKKRARALLAEIGGDHV